MKNKILEALAMGIPIVATPISVDGIDAEHGNHLMVAEPEELAEEVLEVLQDSNLQESLSINGRTLVEQRYSWEEVAQQYARLYQLVNTD